MYDVDKLRGMLRLHEHRRSYTRGFTIPGPEWTELANAAVDALPELLDDVDEVAHLRDQILALKGSNRGYQERAERLSAQLDQLKQDAEDDRDDRR